MSFSTQYAFNLFFNSACSFLAGLCIVSGAVWVFRVDQSRWKLGLLSLPFIKVIWDLTLRGIPSSSIVYSGIDPLSLPPKGQLLTAGAGLSKFGPIFNVVFTTNAPGVPTYTVSVADYLYAFFGRHFGSNVPGVLLIGALLISAGLGLRRLASNWRFEKNRRDWRQTDEALTPVKCGWRTVDVYVSDRFEGTPFTGGVLRPYVCFPRTTVTKLSAQEREAVLQHEIGHIRQWDLLSTVLIQLLGDLFWFIPGYRWLSRKLDRMREVLADSFAVRSGVNPAFLASALIHLQESSVGQSRAVLYSAFFREKKLIRARVDRLLERESSRPPRLGWSNFWMRSLITLWIAGAVMIASFGGNHEVSVREVPCWICRN